MKHTRQLKLKNTLEDLLICAVSLAWFAVVSHAQIPAVNIPITVTDGHSSRTLYFGLDPSATDGLDTALGEAELPPLPPSGVFDARFIGSDIGIPIGQGTAKDYRVGNLSAVGTRTHELSYQSGTGTTIRLNWSLPPGISGRLQDIALGTLINISMNGAGGYTVTNPGALAKLKITVIYNLAANADDSAPAGFVLCQNYPNPFNMSTVIEFSLPFASRVRLEVLNVLGQSVRVLADRHCEVGVHRIEFDATGLAAGTYTYRFEAGTFVGKKKLVLVK